MTESDIIGMYRIAHALSSQMLEAARNNKWEDLIEIEKNYAAEIEQLRTTDIVPIEDPELMKQKADLVRAMLENSEQIQAHTRNWMNELQSSMTSANQEMKLSQAYFSGQF